VTPADPTVFVVDDDAGLRDALELLLRSVDRPTETFASADEFLEAYDPERPGCLILDVRMPGMSGLALQRRLKALDSSLPIIFLTAHGDVPMAVRAVKAGAVDFLQKPFGDQALLDAIQRAIDRNLSLREERTRRREVTDRLASLTPSEREVMGMLADGKSVQTIASALGLTQQTVKTHRLHVMQKMQTDSVSSLIRIIHSVAPAVE
jgi:FixJ family two-component response regulator